jgi:hypothetical protein
MTCNCFPLNVRKERARSVSPTILEKLDLVESVKSVEKLAVDV